MPKKLDMTKPYGTIFGGEGREKYEQDGQSFDVNGDLISAPAPAGGGKKDKKGDDAPADPAPAGGESELDDQLAAQGVVTE